MEYNYDISQLCRTGHEDVSRTRVTTLAYILSYFPLNVSDAISCPLINFNTLWYHDTSQLCRTGLDNVSHTRMTTLAFILSQVFPLDCLRRNFVSTL